MLATPETLHCSNHQYFMNGCSDCETTKLCRLYETGTVEKIFQKVRFKHGIHDITIDHRHPGPKLQMIRQQLQSTLTIFLRKAGYEAAHAAEAVAKKCHKANEDEMTRILEAANAAIDWDVIIDDVASDLAAAAEVGGRDGIAQLAIQHNLVPDMTEKIIAAAQTYASERAAEMVGRKYYQGEYVSDSSAEWVISETTRDDLKDIIELAFQEGMTSSDLAVAIETASTFSPERAELIAKTEIAVAQVQSNLAVWRRTGFVKTVSIILSADHDIEDECDDAANGSPYAIADLPFIPQHPRCRCVLVASEISE